MKQRKPKRYPRWPLVVIGAPAFAAVWSGWTSLGEMCGFGIVHPLPGIWDSFALNTAITLPLGVEAFAAYAIGAWLSYGTPTRAKLFAKWSAISAFVVGGLGQISYHLLAAEHATHAPWPITVAVASLPVVTFGLATTLAHLMHRDDEDGQSDTEAVADDTESLSVMSAIDAAEPVPDVLSDLALDGPESHAEATVEASATPAKATTPRGSTSRSGTRQKAEKIVARKPGITSAELATKLGTTQRTAQRHLSDIRA